MNVIQEVAMLAPVVVIAAINLCLYLAGERGTLLLPDQTAFPQVAIASLPIVQGFLASEPEPEFEEEMRLAA